MQKIALSECIKAVTDELLAAQTQAANSPNSLIMQFNECELELAFEIEGKVEGGISFPIPSFGIKVGGDIKKTNSNTIRVKFIPLTGQSPAAFNANPGELPPPLNDEG
jgi:Trypsin-co-occurring domain 2